MHRRIQIVAAATLEAFGLLALLEVRTLTIGTVARPGPGFFPFCLLVLLCVFSAGLLVMAVRGPALAGAPVALRWRKPAVVLGALFLYAFTLESIGFVASTFLVVVVLLRLEAQSWVLTLVSAAGIALGLYFLFHGLGVRFPAGPWGY